MGKNGGKAQKSNETYLHTTRKMEDTIIKTHNNGYIYTHKIYTCIHIATVNPHPHPLRWHWTVPLEKYYTGNNVLSFVLNVVRFGESWRDRGREFQLDGPEKREKSLLASGCQQQCDVRGLEDQCQQKSREFLKECRAADSQIHEGSL